MKMGAVRTSGSSANKIGKSNISARYRATDTAKIRAVKSCSVLLPERFGFRLAPSAPKRVSPEFSVFSGPILLFGCLRVLLLRRASAAFPKNFKEILFIGSLPRADILIYSTTNNKRSQ